MSSLAVNFLGIPMASPLIGASGTVGFGLELAKFIDMKEIGAISGKGLAPTPWNGNNGTRIAETTSGMLNCIGLENPGAPYFLEHYLPEVKKFGCPYIANMVGKSVEEYAECAKLLSIPASRRSKSISPARMSRSAAQPSARTLSRQRQSPER